MSGINRAELKTSMLLTNNCAYYVSRFNQDIWWFIKVMNIVTMAIFIL